MLVWDPKGQPPTGCSTGPLGKPLRSASQHEGHFCQSTHEGLNAPRSSLCLLKGAGLQDECQDLLSPWMVRSEICEVRLMEVTSRPESRPWQPTQQPVQMVFPAFPETPSPGLVHRLLGAPLKCPVLHFSISGLPLAEAHLWSLTFPGLISCTFKWGQEKGLALGPLSVLPSPGSRKLASHEPGRKWHKPFAIWAAEVHGPDLHTPASLSSQWSEQSPPRVGRYFVWHKSGAPGCPSQATPEVLLPGAGSQALFPVDVLGTVSPLFAPLIPICSATAQIQFRRRVPPASSGALSLRNPFDPAKQRPANLNKSCDISLVGQDTKQASVQARLFVTFWLCWPLSNPLSQHTPLSPPGQTPHFLVDLVTVLTQWDTSIFACVS